MQLFKAICLMGLCVLSTAIYAESKITVTPIAVTADGQKIISYFSAVVDGESTARSEPSPHGYYRVLLNQDQDGYQVQDFYQDTQKKQSSPILLKDAKDLKLFDVSSAVGEIKLYNLKGEMIEVQIYDQQSHYIYHAIYSPQGKMLVENKTEAGSPFTSTQIWHSNGVLAFDFISNTEQQLLDYQVWTRNGKRLNSPTCFIDNSVDFDHVRLDPCILQLKNLVEKYEKYLKN